MKKLFTLFAAFLCACVIGCGGGGGSASEPAWQTLGGPFVLTAEQYKVRYPTMGEGSVFRLECTVTTRGYWNQDGHLAVVARTDVIREDRAIGNGIALGRVLGSAPIPRAEVWVDVHSDGSSGYSRLIPGSEGPPLSDGVPYPFTLESRPTSVRYTIAGFDSGGVPTDALPAEYRGMAFARVGGAAGEIEFSDCRYRWTP